MYIREMRVSDYERIHMLWRKLSPREVRHLDSLEGLSHFLNTYKGLSFVCIVGTQIVGTILCGKENNIGAIYDVSVDENFKGMNIEKSLTATGLSALNDTV